MEKDRVKRINVSDKNGMDGEGAWLAEGRMRGVAGAGTLAGAGWRLGSEVGGEPGRDWGWRRSGGGTSGLEVKRVGESGLEPRAGTGEVMGP